MQLFISCPFGLGKLLAQELKKLGFSPENTFQSGTYIQTDMKGMMEINFRSRLANKVYIQIAEGKAETFDQLFDTIKNSNYGQFVSNTNLSIKVQTHHSQLSATRSIQSITHKALLQSIDHFGKKEKNTTELLVLLDNNLAKLYINTSGAGLHQRGRRKETGTAPLKENLAVALILLAGWRFKSPLFDPFCGSGTLLIEAALLAKNIAPGSWRSFAFEEFKNFEIGNFSSIKEEAKQKIFDGDYQIFGSDSDPKMIAIAKNNAQIAGVGGIIKFEQKNFLEKNISTITDEKSWLISNPPYGKRIGSQDLDLLYNKLRNSFQGNIYGGWISSRPEGKLDSSFWSNKKLFNGNEECQFIWKKPI